MNLESHCQHKRDERVSVVDVGYSVWICSKYVFVCKECVRTNVCVCVCAATRGSGIQDLITVHRAPLQMDFLCLACADASCRALVGAPNNTHNARHTWVSHQDITENEKKVICQFFLKIDAAASATKAFFFIYYYYYFFRELKINK